MCVLCCRENNYKGNRCRNTLKNKMRSCFMCWGCSYFPSLLVIFSSQLQKRISNVRFTSQALQSLLTVSLLQIRFGTLWVFVLVQVTPTKHQSMFTQSCKVQEISLKKLACLEGETIKTKKDFCGRLGNVKKESKFEKGNRKCFSRLSLLGLSNNCWVVRKLKQLLRLTRVGLRAVQFFNTYFLWTKRYKKGNFTIE